MAPARLAQHAATTGSQNQPLLDQEGFDDVLQRVACLGQGGGQGFHPDRSAGMVFGDSAQIAPVHRVEAKAIDLQPGQCGIGEFTVDRTRFRDSGKIADPAEQTTGDAGRTAGTPRDFDGAVLGQREIQEFGAAGDDQTQLLRRVEHQPQRDAEPVPQRCCQQAGSGGGTD